MRQFLLLILIFIAWTTKGQYSFENFPEIKYNKYSNWITWEKGEKTHKTILIPDFFLNGDSLILQLTNFGSLTDSSIIRLYRNNQFAQKILEPPPSIDEELDDTLLVADINGDGLLDIKLNANLFYNGIPAIRRIYLFQRLDTSFVKISFDDRYDEYFGINRHERDFNNDNNYEIITSTLNNFESHNYWTFNLYNFTNGGFVCVNDEYDYPIMIQYLTNPNYTITNRISREQMKKFSNELPDEYDRR
jgi:hypothetical protein